jgi:prepilin-type N-terminal cleavage/methylation domain-containing protein/prepilin-type processing-associated H-X9-DG protein
VSHNRREHIERGFSLVELLVVIGIIGVLLALLMPALSAARAHARQVQCVATLYQIGNAANMHVVEHNYLPAAGWHWKLKEGLVDPGGIGDTAERRYTYYSEDGFKRPAPVTVALGIYLDAKVRLDSRASLEEDLQGDSLRKHFRCPSQEEQGRGLSQKEDGGGWEAPREYSSYVFNEAILGKRDKPYEVPLGRIGMIKRPSDVMLAMDGRPRSEDDNWLMIFDYGPDDTLADWERQIQQGTLGKQSLDRLRHRGRANVLFADFHVDTIPLTEGAMKRVGVSHGVYQ